MQRKKYPTHQIDWLLAEWNDLLFKATTYDACSFNTSLHIVSPIHFVPLFFSFVLLSARARFKSIASTEKSNQKKTHTFSVQQKPHNQCEHAHSMYVCGLWHLCECECAPEYNWIPFSQPITDSMLKIVSSIFLSFVPCVCSIFLLQNHNICLVCKDV